MDKKKSIKDMIFEELERETYDDVDILSCSENDIYFNKGIACAKRAISKYMKQGRWIKVSDPDDNDNVKCKCSVCEAQDEMSKNALENNEVHYCWRCGSYMI
jgi:hypothetical protein